MVMISPQELEVFSAIINTPLPKERKIQISPYPKKSTQKNIGQRGNEILRTANLLLTDQPEQKTLGQIIRAKKMAGDCPHRLPKGLNRFINKIGHKINGQEPYFAAVALADYVLQVARNIRI